MVHRANHVLKTRILLLAVPPYHSVFVSMVIQGTKISARFAQWARISMLQLHSVSLVKAVSQASTYLTAKEIDQGHVLHVLLQHILHLRT